ncbi:MAG: class I SAM-dependent methyltransferase [Hyphomicrobiaceae bacterium]
MSHTFCANADVWDKLLSHQVELLSPAEITAVKALPTWSRVRSIIDIGCGNGDYARQLEAEFPDKSITAVDRSPALVSLAQQRHQNTKIKFEIADIINTAPKGKFDAVILRFVVQHLDDVQNFFSRLQELCHKNTQVIIIEPNPVNSSAQPRLYRLERLIERYEAICEDIGSARGFMKKRDCITKTLGEAWAISAEQSISSDHERNSWCEQELTSVLNGWVTVLECSGALGEISGVRKEISEWAAGPGKSISLGLDILSLRLNEKVQ